MSFIDKLKSLFGSHPQQTKKEQPAAAAQKPTAAAAQKPAARSYAEEKAEAIEWIRGRILESVKKRETLSAVLGSLAPVAADPAFPSASGRKWDHIDICLRIVTAEIYAELSMDDGSLHEERPITPEQLRVCRHRWGLDARYAYLKTEADWQLLITKELRRQAIQSVVHAAQKRDRRNRTGRPPAAQPAQPTAPAKPAPAPMKAQQQVSPEHLARIREIVINTLRARKTYEVPLCSWLWGEAAARFPGGPHSGWEYAGIELDVKSHKLRVDLSRYPNQFGASEQDYESLSPEQFHAKAKDWGVPEQYWDMCTQADWDALYDERLNEAVAELDRIKAKEAEAVRLRHCVVIPEAMYAARPAMKYTAVTLNLEQRYGITSVDVSQYDGAYQVRINAISRLGPMSQGKAATLTAAEAVWLEDRVGKALQDGDCSTFSSLPGGDLMTVVIREGSRVLENRQLTAPLNRYVQLLNSLHQLAQYGSLRASETDRAPD